MKRQVNGVEVETFRKDCVSCNVIDVEVGTTGPLNNNAGKGSRTYFSLRDAACTNIMANVEVDNDRYEFAELEKIEIILERDSEIETFIEALEFAVETLKKQVNGKQKEIPD